MLEFLARRGAKALLRGGLPFSEDTTGHFGQIGPGGGESGQHRVGSDGLSAVLLGVPGVAVKR